MREPLDARSLTKKHREILDEAIRLLGERGYGGASLRELARRTGVQQPSLYHYFRSKDELIEQILDYVGEVMFAAAAPPAPDTLDDVPAALTGAVLYLYQHTDWPLFVRLVFSLSLSEDRHQARLRELFDARASRGLQAFMQPFVARGEIGEDDALMLGRLVINAVGLTLIEQRILYPRHPGPDVAVFADFVARVARAGLAAIRRA